LESAVGEFVGQKSSATLQREQIVKSAVSVSLPQFPTALKASDNVNSGPRRHSMDDDRAFTPAGFSSWTRRAERPRIGRRSQDDDRQRPHLFQVEEHREHLWPGSGQGTRCEVQPRTETGREAKKPPPEAPEAGSEAAQQEPAPLSANAVLLNNIFEAWMQLHEKVEQADGLRKSKYMGLPFCKSYGPRHGKQTYGKDHSLVKEAFLVKDASLGPVLDHDYIKQHIHKFADSFQKLWGMVEGVVPWQMLQFMGYLFHHMHLLAEMAAEGYGSILNDFETMKKAQENNETSRQVEISKLKDALGSSKPQIEELEKTVIEKDIRIKELEAELQSIRLSLASLSDHADPKTKLETLQKQYKSLKDEDDRLREAYSELQKELRAVEDENLKLQADSNRDRNLYRLVEDTLPANSDRVKQKLGMFTSVLSPESMETLVHAVSLGNDAQELYSLMMGRSMQGHELQPYMGLMGRLRKKFDAVHLLLADDTHAKQGACDISERPLTKSFMISILKRNDVQELMSRCGEELVQKMSVAINHGIDAYTMVQLLDGRMSNKGTCMITYRALFGTLKSVDSYSTQSQFAKTLEEACSCCSLNTILHLQFSVRQLQQKLAMAEDRAKQLENEIRVRDFKFGELIGVTGSGEDVRGEGNFSVANTWTLSSITKLDEFLAMDHDGDFEALGTSTEIPKFLRAKGIVKNIHMPKSETEQLITDIWAEKEKHDKGKKRHILSLQEFMPKYLEHRFGDNAVTMAYNLLHSCHKYKYDPDCEVFLQVLDGRVSQDIYHEFNTAIETLLCFLQLLDAEIHNGIIKGSLKGEEIHAMLQCLFSNKSHAMLADLYHALGNDVSTFNMDANDVKYLSLFFEDHDANQGSFATLLKRQHIQERMRFLHDLQMGLITCCKEHQVTELGSRQVEDVLRTMGVKVS